ncbi:hypothetical protein F5Y11DRAFT_349284 [Daldinia sp. FL1419]|nr:hypothetical protein F5Y11DRAFT_349284 [Daldinia sp. FL1419]
MEFPTMQVNLHRILQQINKNSNVPITPQPAPENVLLKGGLRIRKYRNISFSDFPLDPQARVVSTTCWDAVRSRRDVNRRDAIPNQLLLNHRHASRPRASRIFKTSCDTPCCKVEVERRDQVSSQYCKKHTCEHFWEPLFGAERCPNHKHPEDSVCTQHIECTTVGCVNARLQYYDRDRAGTPQYKRRKYCCDHKCAVTECPHERAVMLAPNQYRPFCDDREL